jgi:nucleotide-binding universal stress UspA family protein
MFKHILIPTDGSPLAGKAVKAGIAMAAKLGARVTVYYAREPLVQVHYGDGYIMDRHMAAELDARSEAAAKAVLDKIGKAARAAKVPFTGITTVERSPYEGIVATAKKRKCDVIFIASHGRRGLTGVVLGSVTNKVLSHSKLPVMVYR